MKIELCKVFPRCTKLLFSKIIVWCSVGILLLCFVKPTTSSGTFRASVCPSCLPPPGWQISKWVRTVFHQTWLRSCSGLESVRACGQLLASPAFWREQTRTYLQNLHLQDSTIFPTVCRASKSTHNEGDLSILCRFRKPVPF